MWRFLFLTVILMVIGGIILHMEISVPYISSWLGKLPGDFELLYRDVTIFFPVVSAALVSFVISLPFWLIANIKKH